MRFIAKDGWARIGKAGLFWVLLGGLGGWLAFRYFLVAPNLPPPPMMAEQTPKELAGVGLDDHLGQRVDLSLEFTNEEGLKVPLQTYFQGNRPVLLSMVYFGCPSLCNFHLNGLLSAFKEMRGQIGRDFEVLSVSMDARETDFLADEKKAAYLRELGEPEAAKGWHFLTGTEENIRRLADALGFRFSWNEEQQQFAHAAVAYVLTPDGTISRSLNGIEFQPQTLRLSFVEASAGKIGTIVEQLILTCFQFNPEKNKYTLFNALNLVRLAGLLVVMILIVFLVPTWRTGKSARRA